MKLIMKNTVLAKSAIYLPEEIVTSDEIENRLSPVYQRLKLPQGRLELMTGIHERRVWDEGTRPSHLSTMAAQKALDQSGCPKEEIDLLIHASVCRDFLEPSTASVIHAQLGLSPQCMLFDLSNACLGVLNATVMAAQMIENEQIQTALIVSGENAGPLLNETIRQLNQDQTLNRKNIKKYIANLTIGSGAVAWLITRKELSPQSPRFLGGHVLTDSSANILCQGDGNPHSLMMETDSEKLLHAGLKLAKKNWALTKETLNKSEKDFDWVITHQVGKAHEQLTLESLKLSKNKTHKTYPYLGNTGSAALPITLWELENSKSKPQKDDTMALLGIGSGLTSIMLGLQY
jgi:acyl-CoA:acyl-CoA alkyltransferase